MIPGLLAAAKAQGVHHKHLYMVLTGRRESARALRAYGQWLANNPDFTPAREVLDRLNQQPTETCE